MTEMMRLQFPPCTQRREPRFDFMPVTALFSRPKFVTGKQVYSSPTYIAKCALYAEKVILKVIIKAAFFR